MSEAYSSVEQFWDYLIFYPDEDEEGYDGIHSGGIRGISDDAPENVKKAYHEYLESEKKNREQGIKV